MPTSKNLNFFLASFIVISGSKPLMDLLQSLATETGQKAADFKLHAVEGGDKEQSEKSQERLRTTSSFEDNLHLESLPLSEEDLLKKPFYTVEEPLFKQEQDNFPQGKWLYYNETKFPF